MVVLVPLERGRCASLSLSREEKHCQLSFRSAAGMGETVVDDHCLSGM